MNELGDFDFSLLDDDSEERKIAISKLTTELSRLRSENERLRGDVAQSVKDRKNLMESYRYDTGQLKGDVEALQRDAQAHMVSLNEAGKFTMELSKSLADHKAELEAARTQLDDAYKAIGLSNFSSEPLSCYLQRYLDALKKAKRAIRKNHKWHQRNENHAGYRGSKLESSNESSLTAINALNL